MLMSDKWITKASQGDRPLIAPFINHSVSRLPSGHNVTSFGLSSYGYDLALGNKFKVLRKTSNSTGARFIDPNNFDPYLFVDQEVQDGDVFVLPPGSFALGVTRERMIMPDDIMGVCMQKSTIARSALEVTVTPIEAGWEGWLTLELHNKTDLPIHLRPGMGIVQLMFFQGIEPCSVPYHARNGKYNNQEQAPVAPRAKQHEVPAVTGALTVTAEAYEEASSLLDFPPLEPHDISTNTPPVGAAVLGAVKNAIGRTKVDVEIDPDEPDSQAVFDLIKTEVVRAKQIQTTPNSVNPTDVLGHPGDAGTFDDKVVKPYDPALPAFQNLKKALQADPDYAWSWHCNIAMNLMDNLGSYNPKANNQERHRVCNEAAAKMMNYIFNIDTAKHEHYETTKPRKFLSWLPKFF